MKILKIGNKNEASFSGLKINKNVADELLRKEIQNNTFIEKLAKKHDVKVSYNSKDKMGPTGYFDSIDIHKIEVEVDGKKYDTVMKDHDNRGEGLRFMRRLMRTFNNDNLNFEYREESALKTWWRNFIRGWIDS